MAGCEFYKGWEESKKPGMRIILCGNGKAEMTAQECDNVNRWFCLSDSGCKKCNFYKKHEEEITMEESREITITGAAELTAEYKEAVSVHQRIKVSAETAASALVEMCKALKTMRDRELYKQLGFDAFGDYVEHNGDYSFKERQAYNYIKTYEALGERFLQSNAEIGITKLELLTKIPGYERAGIVEENDLAGMSVAEIKELVKKNQEQGEQLSMLTDALQATDKSLTAQNDAVRDLQQTISTLQAELDAVKSAPVDIAVAEPSVEDLAKIKEDAKKEAEKEYKKKLKDATAKAKLDIEKAQRETAQQYKAEQERVESERKALEEKLKKGTSDESIIAFKFYWLYSRFR